MVACRATPCGQGCPHPGEDRAVTASTLNLPVDACFLQLNLGMGVSVPQFFALLLTNSLHVAKTSAVLSALDVVSPHWPRVGQV